METPNVPATVIEIALLLTGVMVLVRWQFSDHSVAYKQARLAPWRISLSDFLMYALFAVLGAMIAQFLALTLQRRYPDLMADELWILVQGGAFQLGVLAGVLTAGAFAKSKLARDPIDTWSEMPEAESADVLPLSVPETPVTSVQPLPIHPLVGGLLVFLAALPLVLLTGLVWQTVLKWAGVEVEQQELVDLLTKTDSPLLIAGMGILAVAIAPLMEEIVFRAGLFRYLRTRVPRISAFLISAVLFSALHANTAAFAPLVVFGVVLAIAYERTGRIEIPMVAHALFNLHTLVLLLAGVTT